MMQTCCLRQDVLQCFVMEGSLPHILYFAGGKKKQPPKKSQKLACITLKPKISHK